MAITEPGVGLTTTIFPQLAPVTNGLYWIDDKVNKGIDWVINKTNDDNKVDKRAIKNDILKIKGTLDNMAQRSKPIIPQPRPQPGPQPRPSGGEIAKRIF